MALSFGSFWWFQPGSFCCSSQACLFLFGILFVVFEWSLWTPWPFLLKKYKFPMQKKQSFTFDGFGWWGWFFLGWFASHFRLSEFICFLKIGINYIINSDGNIYLKYFWFEDIAIFLGKTETKNSDLKLFLVKTLISELINIVRIKYSFFLSQYKKL